MNQGKCYVMTLAWKSKTIKYNYKLNNNTIDRVHEHKDLGIMIDSKLTFIPHIDKQVNKARGMSALIRRLSGGNFSQATLRSLYMSLVRSLLDYGSNVYNPNYAVHSNKIESIKKQFLIYAMPNEQRNDE